MATRERAAVMVELIIIFPIALMAISAIIDFGMAAQRSEQIAEIARQAARLAAIVSFEDDASAPVDQYTCPASPPACDETGGWQDTCMDTQELSCLALKEARGALIEAGIDPADWIVKSRVCDIDVVSNRYAAVQVEIAKNPNSRGCWICLGDYMTANVGAARALFAVESAC